MFNNNYLNCNFFSQCVHNVFYSQSFTFLDNCFVFIEYHLMLNYKARDYDELLLHLTVHDPDLCWTYTAPHNRKHLEMTTNDALKVYLQNILFSSACPGRVEYVEPYRKFAVLIFWSRATEEASTVVRTFFVHCM